MSIYSHELTTEQVGQLLEDLDKDIQRAIENESTRYIVQMDIIVILVALGGLAMRHIEMCQKYGDKLESITELEEQLEAARSAVELEQDHAEALREKIRALGGAA